MLALMKKLYGLQMTQKLSDFLKSFEQRQYAAQKGTDMHLKMQHIVIDDKNGNIGDENIINIIKSKPELLSFFSSAAQTEAPISGFINDIFVSRRIDRLLINHETKVIDFIDYKTDTDKSAFVEQYKCQLKGYAELLHSAYPNYKINGYVLWLHDWTLDKII